VSFFHFHIRIQNTSTIYTLIHPFLVSTSSQVHTAGKHLLFSPALHFLKTKCILIVQGGFALILQVCIYCVFIKLTSSPALLTHYLSPCSPNIQQLTVKCIILYSYIESYIFHSLTFSFSFLPPIAPSYRPHKYNFVLPVTKYIYKYIIMCSFHI
jgi:hypothetical protein